MVEVSSAPSNPYGATNRARAIRGVGIQNEAGSASAAPPTSQNKRGNMKGTCYYATCASCSALSLGASIALPGNRRTDYITDAVDKCPFRFRQLYRSQGIGCFSRLGYGDHDISRMDHRIPVTKFRGIFHFDRDTAQIFDQMFADQSSMPGSTTGNNYNPVGIQEFIPIIDYAGKYHTISFYIDSAPDTIL